MDNRRLQQGWCKSGTRGVYLQGEIVFFFHVTPYTGRWYIIWVELSNIFHFHLYLGKIPMLTNIFQTSHEKNPGWLGYIGDYTTQLLRDYNKPL